MLFRSPLSEASTTFTQIHSAHPDTPLKLVWHAAGHDGGVNETERLQALTLTWFKRYLADEAVDTGPVFEATLASGSVVSNSSRNQLKFFTANDFPGVRGNSTQSITLAGKPQAVLAPAGGQPGLITVLPGLGGSQIGRAHV